MTRYRQKLVSLASLTAALALAVAGGFLFSPQARSARAVRGRLLHAEPDEVSRVEVSGGPESLAFERYGGSWSLVSGAERFPARAERAEAFLETVGAVRTLEAAARSQDAWKSYGLGADESRRVRFLGSDGKLLADFHVGRYSANGADSYVRREGDERSCKVAAAVASRLPSDRKSWLDLRAFGESVPPEDVQRLRVQGRVRFSDGTYYGAAFSLTRSLSSLWRSDEIPELDPSAADRFVRSVMNAEAEDYSPDGLISADEAGLRLELELGGGTLKTLRIAELPDGTGSHRASLMGSGRVMLLGEWTLRDILKAPSDLRRKTPEDTAR